MILEPQGYVLWGKRRQGDSRKATYQIVILKENCSGKCGASGILKGSNVTKRRAESGDGKSTGDVLDESVSFKGAPFTGVPWNGAGNETRTRDPNLGKVVRFLVTFSNCAGFRPMAAGGVPAGVPISANSRDFRLWLMSV